MKIQIIGGSGTGKSTLAKYISDKEHILWIDTDTYLWKDDTFTENNSMEQRQEMYEKDRTSSNSYVVSGSIFSWFPEGFNDRDLFVFLTLDETVRMERLRKREMSRHREMWLDEHGEMTNDFVEWCKTYWKEIDKNKVGTYVAQINELELAESPVLKLDSSQPTEELYLKIISWFRTN